MLHPAPEGATGCKNTCQITVAGAILKKSNYAMLSRTAGGLVSLVVAVFGVVELFLVAVIVLWEVDERLHARFLVDDLGHEHEDTAHEVGRHDAADLQQALDEGLDLRAREDKGTRARRIHHVTSHVRAVAAWCVLIQPWAG